MDAFIKYFEVLSIFIVVWIAMFLSVFLHELGHVTIYQLIYGEKDWHITVGCGKTVLQFKKITVKLISLTGSYVYWTEQKCPKYKKILVSLGGGLANCVLIVGCFLLAILMDISQVSIVKFPYIASFIRIMFSVNFYMLVLTLIPMKFTILNNIDYISDGYQVYSTIIKKE